jgi:hypothetical protein
MSTDMVMGRVTTSTLPAYPGIQELLKHIDPPKKTKVATGCPLCNNIWSSAETYKKFFNDSDAYYKTVIVVYDDEAWLYTMCDDWYLMQIDYCPKCGRKLVRD